MSDSCCWLTNYSISLFRSLNSSRWTHFLTSAITSSNPDALTNCYAFATICYNSSSRLLIFVDCYLIESNPDEFSLLFIKTISFFS